MVLPNLEKLRRFTFGTGLILLAYFAAGVDLEPGAKISILGIPSIIRRPELLSTSLIVASVYALFRFYYYGFMLGHSPHSCRRNVLHKLHAEVPGSRGNYNGSVFFGPKVYSITPSLSNRADAETQLKEIINTFPKVGGVSVTGKVEPYHFYDEEGDEHIAYNAHVTIPATCRVASFLQDLDYMAPILLNVGALTLAAVRIVVG